MSQDRTRPFLLQPVFYGVPISWVDGYFKSYISNFRKNNPEFDEFLKEMKEEISLRQLDYCSNILLFLDGKTKPNWVSPKNSMFRLFIKLYNYDWSGKQAVDYIDRCHETYLSLKREKLKLGEEYDVFMQRSRWDGVDREALTIDIEPINRDNNDYYLKLIFSSLQNDTSFDSLCDTDITMMSSRELYEDALILFDYYQGYSYLNKVLEFAIKEMINKRIIKPPIKMTYRGGYTLSYYPIHSVYPYKVKDIR